MTSTVQTRLDINILEDMAIWNPKIESLLEIRKHTPNSKSRAHSTSKIIIGKIAKPMNEKSKKQNIGQNNVGEIMTSSVLEQPYTLMRMVTWQSTFIMSGLARNDDEFIEIFNRVLKTNFEIRIL